MRLKIRINFICFSICFVYGMIKICSSDNNLYMSVEHATVLYQNPVYISKVVFKSKRISRRDPVYYATLNVTLCGTLDNKVWVNFSFYQLLSNEYKRSFVEMPMNLCHLFEKDQFLGPTVNAAYRRTTGRNMKCPMKPGFYSMKDAVFHSIKPLLPHFPFQEGRAYLNISRLQQHIACGYLDFQIKSLAANQTTRGDK